MIQVPHLGAKVLYKNQVLLCEITQFLNCQKFLVTTTCLNPYNFYFNKAEEIIPSFTVLCPSMIYCKKTNHNMIDIKQLKIIGEKI